MALLHTIETTTPKYYNTYATWAGNSVKVSNPVSPTPPPTIKQVAISFNPNTAHTIQNALTIGWKSVGMVLEKNIGGVPHILVISEEKGYRLMTKEKFNDHICSD